MVHKIALYGQSGFHQTATTISRLLQLLQLISRNRNTFFKPLFIALCFADPGETVINKPHCYETLVL